jgi:hypothetical protein
LVKKVRLLKSSFLLITQLPPHIALTLLRYSHGTPKLVYSFRSHSPQTTQAAAILLRHFSFHTLCAILKLPNPSPSFFDHASLPLRSGTGLGVTDATIINAPAYIASLAAAANTLQCSTIPPPPTPANNPTLFADIATTLAHLKAHTPQPFHEAFPQVTADFFRFYAVGGAGNRYVDKFQRAITHEVETLRALSLQQQNLTPAYRAAIASSSSKYAAAVISTYPSPNTPDARAFTLSCLHRTQQSPVPFDLSPTFHCLCGVVLRNEPWHILPCQALARTSTFNDNWRHHACVRDLVALCKVLGAVPRREPRNLAPFAPLEGPDIRVRLGPDLLLLDFSCTHAYSATHINAGRAFNRTSVFQHISTEKHATYDDIADYHGAVFVPFLANTHGALGPEAIEFCKLLATYASTHGPFKSQWDYPSAYTFIINSVTSSLHTRFQTQIDDYITLVRAVNGL